MKRKLYREIASTVDAYHRCVERGAEEWQLNHRDHLDKLVKNFLPSGSGIDNGTTLDIDRSTGEKLVFTFGYHHMNDVGMYDGWTEHILTVKASLTGEIDLRISGRNRNGIKDYLYETYNYSLTQEIDTRFHWEYHTAGLDEDAPYTVLADKLQEMGQLDKAAKVREAIR